MTETHATTPTIGIDEARLALADHRTYIDQLFLDLTAQLPLVHALLDSRRRGLGFLTAEGRRALDDLVRTEKQIRRDNARLGFPEPSGNTTAPTALGPLQVLAEVTFTLRHLARRLHKALAGVGICPLVGGLPGDATPGELIAHLYRLVQAAPSPSLYDEVIDELEHLVAIAKRTVDGNDRTVLDDPCPHCGLNTLVAYLAPGVIRCDRDRDTGHFAHCICTDWFCPCHGQPITHRHEWTRANAASATSWEALNDLLNNARRKKETTPS